MGSCEHGNEPLVAFLKIAGNSLVAEQLLTSQKGLNSMEVIN
jgi:hypothetical protein